MSLVLSIVNTCLLRETNGLMGRVDWNLEAWVQVLTFFFSCMILDKSVHATQFLCLKKRGPNNCPNSKGYCKD